MPESVGGSIRSRSGSGQEIGKLESLKKGVNGWMEMSERMQLRGSVKRHCLGKEQNAVTKNALGRADFPHEKRVLCTPGICIGSD